MYDIKKHGDFKKYYDTTQKRNYWVLGYFGGGSVNISEGYELAKQFAEATGVEVNTVRVDEILSSRRFKYFKYLFSDTKNQQPEKDSDQMDNVFAWLTS